MDYPHVAALLPPEGVQVPLGSGPAGDLSASALTLRSRTP